MSKDSFGLASGWKLSKLEAIGTALLISTFILLPIGRTVEIPTVLMAVWGLLLLVREGIGAAWRRPDIRVFSVLFLLYWGPMVISLFGAYDFSNSAFFCLKYLRFVFAGYFVLYLITARKIKTLVLSALSVVVGSWLLDSLYQWWAGIDLFGRTYDGNRLLGPFKHLIMPIFLSVFLPLVLIYTKIKWPRYLFWMLFGSSLWILFLAGSRASWMVLLFGGLLYSIYVFVRLEKKPFISMVLVIIGAIGIGIAGYHYESGFKGRIDRTIMAFSHDYKSIDLASSHRLPIWETAFNMALDNPLVGVGVKGFHGSYSRYAKPDDPFKDGGATHPHMFFLEVLTETGLVGFVSMLVALGLIFRLGIGNLKRWSPLQAGAAATLAITFFPFNTHVSLYGSIYSQVAWLMAAVSLAWIYDPDETVKSNKRLSVFNR